MAAVVCDRRPRMPTPALATTHSSSFFLLFTPHVRFCGRFAERFEGLLSEFWRQPNAVLAADANNMAAMPLQLSVIAVATAATLTNVPSVDSRAADQSHEAPWLESASSALVASSCCRAAEPTD